MEIQLNIFLLVLPLKAKLASTHLERHEADGSRVRLLFREKSSSPPIERVFIFIVKPPQRVDMGKGKGGGGGGGGGKTDDKKGGGGKGGDKGGKGGGDKGGKKGGKK